MSYTCTYSLFTFCIYVYCNNPEGNLSYFWEMKGSKVINTWLSHKPDWEWWPLVLKMSPPALCTRDNSSLIWNKEMENVKNAIYFVDIFSSKSNTNINITHPLEILYFKISDNRISWWFGVGKLNPLVCNHN